jgi:hypothetical protein
MAKFFLWYSDRGKGIIQNPNTSNIIIGITLSIIGLTKNKTIKSKKILPIVFVVVPHFCICRFSNDVTQIIIQLHTTVEQGTRLFPALILIHLIVLKYSLNSIRKLPVRNIIEKFSLTFFSKAFWIQKNLLQLLVFYLQLLHHIQH